MTHPDWELQRERLSAYLDGEVNADERASLDAHLPACEPCQRELAALRQTRTLLAALPAPSLPRSFTLPAEPARIEDRRRAPAWSRPAQAIGSIAAMVGLGLLVGASLPHLGTSRGMAGAATSAAAPVQYGSADPGALATSGTAPTQRAGTDTSVPTPGQAPVHAPVNPGAATSPSQPVFPVLPVSGGVLLVGGVATATAGSLARRKARRDAVDAQN